MKNRLAELEDRLRAALDSVPDPISGRGLVAAGRLLSLQVREGGRVLATIEAPAAAVGAFAKTRDRAEAALRAHADVTEAFVALTAHAGPPAAPPVTRVRKGDAPPPRVAQPPGSRHPEGVAGVERLVAVASAKGGVGKSTVAVNLAVALARLGLRTGLLDVDIYGPSIPTMLGCAAAKPETGPGGKLLPVEAHGVKTMSIGYLVDVDAPMIWRGPMATSAVRQMLDDVLWAPLDVLVLDLPPGTGDVQLTIAQRLPLSGAVIVSTPQELALADVRRGLAMFERTAIPILGVVETMAWLDLPDGSRLHPFGQGGARRTAERFGAPFLGELPLDPELREAGDAGAPLSPDHPMARRFETIAQRMLDAIEGAAKPPPVIRFT